MYHEELNRLQQTAIASAMKEQSERNSVNKTPTKLETPDFRDDHDGRFKENNAGPREEDQEIKKEGGGATPKSEPNGAPPPTLNLPKQFFPTSPQVGMMMMMTMNRKDFDSRRSRTRRRRGPSFTKSRERRPKWRELKFEKRFEKKKFQQIPFFFKS